MYVYMSIYNVLSVYIKPKKDKGKEYHSRLYKDERVFSVLSCLLSPNVKTETSPPGRDLPKLVKFRTTFPSHGTEYGDSQPRDRTHLCGTRNKTTPNKVCQVDT